MFEWKIFLKIIIFLTLSILLPQISFGNSTIFKTPTNAETENPIIFIHGWNKDNSNFNTFKNWFIDDGWSAERLFAYNFEDKGNCSIPANINNANQIETWITTILSDTGAQKVDLIGHSMGGLNSRYYIKFLGGIDYIDDYVSLGSPHHGENIADCGRNGLNDLAVLLNEGDETPGGILNDTIGDRIDPISGIKYNGSHIAGNINFTSIYSLADAIPSQSPPLDGAYNVELTGLTHTQLYTSKQVYDKIKLAFMNETDTSQEDTTSNTNASSIGILPVLLAIFVTIKVRKK